MKPVVLFRPPDIDRVKSKIPFFALDVGQRLDGSWMVVELNDGQ